MNQPTDPQDQSDYSEVDLQQVQPALDLIARVRNYHQQALLDTAKGHLGKDQITPREQPSEPSGFVVDREGTPRQVGRFEIVRRIGQGGFGIVFQAYDPRIDRDVALKIPRPEAFLDESLRERFLREARAAGALNHANIVTVFEANQVGPICYIASAWCQGPTLHQWVIDGKGTLAANEAIDATIVLADAVQHAHNRGVIHRDLKPQNILIDLEPIPKGVNPFWDKVSEESDDKDGADGSAGADPKPAKPAAKEDSTPMPIESQLRISDFGLARVMSECASITKSGSIVGTPAYAAPEQLDGSSQPVDARADVYALGATMYFLLCGEPPFSGSTLVETIRKVQEELARSLRKINPQVSADLEAICLKCLQKNPQHRYQSASELQSDLIRCREGLPVTARRPGQLDRLVAWCRRRPAVAGLSAALMLLLLASSIVLGILLAQSNQLKELAENSAAQATAERDRARAALDAMTSGLATRQVLGQQELTAQQRRFLEQTVDWYRELTMVASDAAPLDQADQLWLARAEKRLSQLLGRLGDLEGALEAIDRSIVLLEPLLVVDDSSEIFNELIQSLHRKDGLIMRSGRHAEALPIVESAVELARLGVDRHPDSFEIRNELANALGNLGTRYRSLNRPEESELVQLESVILKRHLVQERPDDNSLARGLGISLMNLGNLLTLVNRTDEAEEFLTEALEIRQKLADDHPHSEVLNLDLAYILRNMAGLSVHVGDYEQAAVYAERSAELGRRLVANHPLAEEFRRIYVDTLALWSAALTNRLEFDLSIEVLDELSEASAEAIATYPNIPWYRVRLALSKLRMGQLFFRRLEFEAAREQFDQAIDDFNALLAQNAEMPDATLELRQALHHRGKALERLGRFEEAVNDFEAAVELADQPTWANIHRLGKAAVLARTDRETEALDIVGQATDYENGLELSIRNYRVYVRAACVYGILAERSDEEQRDELLDEALSYLEQAIAAGLTDLSTLRNEPHLASLYQHPQFQALIASDRE